MALFYDAHRHEAPKYNVGDKVWLSSENIRTVHLTKKLNYKWLGPYTVQWVISHSAYWLKLPVSFGNIHPIFSVTVMTRSTLGSDPSLSHAQPSPTPWVFQPSRIA